MRQEKPKTMPEYKTQEEFNIIVWEHLENLERDHHTVNVEILGKLNSLEKGQKEHTKILDRQTDILGKIVNVLEHHTELLEKHTELLEKHTEILEDISEKLK